MLHRLSLALALVAMAPVNVIAAPPPDPVPIEGVAYLGQLDSAGAWVEQHFVGMPEIAPTASDHALRAPVDVQVRSGVKLLDQRKGREVGRLRRGAHVQLLSVRVSGSGEAWYAWGRVRAPAGALAALPYADRSAALAVDPPIITARSHTRGGFTGRSGSGPSLSAPQLHAGGITRSTC